MHLSSPISALGMGKGATTNRPNLPLSFISGGMECWCLMMAALDPRSHWPTRPDDSALSHLLVVFRDAGDGAPPAELASSPVVVLTGTRRLLGGEWSFAEHMSSRYGLRLDLNPQQLEQLRSKHVAEAAAAQLQASIAAEAGAGKRCLLLVEL